MICHFCHQEMKFSYREALLDYDVYECLHRPHTVKYYQYPEAPGISISLKIKDKFYIVDLWLPDYECLVCEVNEQGNWLETVLELKFVPPDWNPTNIEAKLKTALVFL